jgi:class 3 adenylate cyclase
MSRKRALLIGNTQYLDERFLPLTAPTEDAKDLAEVLKHHDIGSFDEVITLLDEPNNVVRREVARFFKNNEKEDLLVLFFSGHGVRSERGELYLAQKDTEYELLSATGIPAHYIADLMDESRSKSQILILDCCFSGAFDYRPKSAIGSTAGTRGHFSQGGSGHTVLTATDSVQYAFEGEKIIGEAKNSLFTHYLVKGLRSGDADANHNGYITVDELFDYAYENVQMHAPRQTPCKWSYKQHGEIIIARNPQITSANRRENRPLIRMEPSQQAVACGLLLVLNSLLAGLGSLLWNHFPYWPAFMICGLACIYLGASWGIVLAALTPLLESVLGIGDAPPFYIPVNILQALLLLGAFRYGRIDPKLQTWTDRIKYILLAVSVPSLLGGSLAWILGNWLMSGVKNPGITVYTLWWTGENVLPAILPGIWLHQVAGELYAPFRWQTGGKVESWRRRTLEYATPGMAALLLFAALIIGLISQQLGLGGPAGGLSHAWTVSVWKSVYDLTSKSWMLRFLVLALMVSILYSLGSSIRFAKRTWVLEVAVSRQLPFFFNSSPPSGRRLVSVLSINILDFKDIADSMPYQRLLTWITRYFDCVSDVCSALNGYVDNLADGRLRVVFGMKGVDSGVAEAIQCALKLAERFESLNQKFTREGYPLLRIGVGIDSGPIVAGEVGSQERRQFTVLGEAVCIAREMDERVRNLPGNITSVILSYRAAMESGLLAPERAGEALIELPSDMSSTEHPLRAFAIGDIALVEELLVRSLIAESADE